MIKATPPIRCSRRQAPAGQLTFHVQLRAGTVSPDNVLNASVAVSLMWDRAMQTFTTS